MGYIIHHTIVVTGWDEDTIEKARGHAIKSFERAFEDSVTNSAESLVSPIVTSICNRYCSFFIAPDGSKSGWEASDAGDYARSLICLYLKENDIDFISVAFGGDVNDAFIEDSIHNYTEDTQ